MTRGDQRDRARAKNAAKAAETKKKPEGPLHSRREADAAIMRAKQEKAAKEKEGGA